MRQTPTNLWNGVLAVRGDISSAKKAKRHPLDWYVEEHWLWHQVARAIRVEYELNRGVAIWDPAAGYGHSGSALEEWGFKGRIHLSDVVHNVAYEDFIERPNFFSADFLELDAPPATPCSIWMNPPYSYKDVVLTDGRKVSIAEAFVRQALRLATHRVVILMPVKWLASQTRFRLFTEFPPAAVLIFSQRPSMPPGDVIHLMGSKAFRGGVLDYCAIVWDVQYPTARDETRTIWLPPLSGEQ